MRRIVGGSIGAETGLILIVAMLLGSTCLRSLADEPASRSQEPKKVEEAARTKDVALKAAENYLVLLDKGKFAESWEASAGDLRRGISRQKWVDALNQTRRPLGRPRSRKLVRIEMKAGEVPERVDHAWVYCQAQFVNGGEPSGELLVVYLEKGKDWKVSAYFIGDPDTFPKPPASEKEKEAKTAESKESKSTGPPPPR